MSRKARKRRSEYARELAERFQLPPDQSVLVKVITLGDKRLTRLALEELLELEDRGRVRVNPELVEALEGVRHRDREIREIRDLLLQKLRVTRAVEQ